MGIKSPTPYRYRKLRSIKYGMNFAYGGTGVFDTLVAAPNKTKQIDLFEQLLKEKLYTKDGLKFSTALVSVSGNDYGIYLARGGSPQGLPAFIVSVVKQLGLDRQRNLAALFHNLLLTSMVEELKPESKFVVLDMYDAFMSAMKKHENGTGSSFIIHLRLGLRNFKVEESIEAMLHRHGLACNFLSSRIFCRKRFQTVVGKFLIHVSALCRRSRLLKNQ
ncbi:GDSL esterase/lipase [Vitis vinifera]|uniref:GDSL esterase/lipase n=1 Tax=Vitis vinifera TaxID=29760 RepID=A0A438DNJ5_VITVI|nr:GDSL esterase/lipase [Vitis vinifera]